MGLIGSESQPDFHVLHDSCIVFDQGSFGGLNTLSMKGSHHYVLQFVQG